VRAQRKNVAMRRMEAPLRMSITEADDVGERAACPYIDAWMQL
jgi:hypothetical protein